MNILLFQLGISVIESEKINYNNFKKCKSIELDNKYIYMYFRT